MKRGRLPTWWGPNLIWLLVTRALRSLAQALMVVAIPLELAKLGDSASRVGLLLSLGAFGSAIMVLGVGVLADRLGRKRLLLVVAILGCLGSAGFVFTNNYWLLAAMAAISSMGKGGGAGSAGGYGAFYPAEQPLIADCAKRPADRNAVFSTVSFVALFASVIGSLIVFSVGGRTSLHSLHALLWVSFLASIGTVIAVAPIKERRLERAETAQKRSSKGTFPLVVRLWVTGGLNGLALGVLGPFLAYWLHRRFGMGAGDIGLLFLIGNVLMALSAIVAPALGRAIGAVRTTSWTRLASVVSLIGLALSPNLFAASVAFLIRTVLNGIGGPVRQSFVMGVSDERHRSRVAAFGNLPAVATGVASPSIAAWLFVSVAEEAPIWFAAVLTALSAIFYGTMFKTWKPPEERVIADGINVTEREVSPPINS
ncbi:MAG TPA: MFS transporter [Acidimicrobiales bacterium]|nr:MFS transporter [Acidimicrobiales bacterium]